MNFDGGQSVVGISCGHFQKDTLVDRDFDCDIGIGREFDFRGDIWDDFYLVDDRIVIGFIERVDRMDSVVSDFSFDRVFRSMMATQLASSWVLSTFMSRVSLAPRKSLF